MFVGLRWLNFGLGFFCCFCFFFFFFLTGLLIFACVAEALNLLYTCIQMV